MSLAGPVNAVARRVKTGVGGRGMMPSPMQLLRPAPDQALLGLRAMTMVARADGEMSLAARNLLMATQRQLLRTDHDLDALAPIEPAALAAGFTDPGLREQFVGGMQVMSLTDGPATPTRLAVVQRFADALGVRQASLHDLHLLAQRRTLLFRLDFLRRGHLVDMLRQQYEDSGLLGSIKALLGLRGWLADPALAARYHALAKLPADSLGHALFHHYHDHGFAFPGERHGFPEAGVYHDLAHVISGYGTDPLGELQVGAFIAGFKRESPFYVLLFVMLTFSAGVNVTPLPQPHMTGILATPGLADQVFVALARGGQLNTDLTDHWDYGPLLPLPLAEVRQRLGLVQ